jgi:hypothetical protein
MHDFGSKDGNGEAMDANVGMEPIQGDHDL